MINMKALLGLLLLGFGQGVSSVIHSRQYFCASSSGLSSFPEFVAVGMVDRVQTGSFDSISKRIELKQAWMEVTREHQDYVKESTGLGLRAWQVYKAEIETLKKRFNQTGGAHIFQSMSGCEWDDEDGFTGGYHQYGYDGEDFIVFDLETLTWIAPTSQAFTTKMTWDQNRANNEFLKNYLTKECIDWLKKFLASGNSPLQRTERPQVSLLQRTPSSPVRCHATGFYPDRVVVFWTRDGQEVYEGVDLGRVLPNHDGTFQVSVDLDLTSVPKEGWGRYQCVVQLKGIKDIFTPLVPARIRTNWEHQSDITTPIIIGCVVLLLSAFVAAAGFVLYKRRNGVPKRLPVGSDSRSKNTEEQAPAPEAQPLTTRVRVES